MIKPMKILLISIILSIILVGGVLAENLPAPSQDCNSIKSDLIILNQTYNDTLTQLVEYRNLTNYYKILYESQDVNVSNLQLINLNTNIQVLNQKVENLENKITLFSFEVGFSIVSLSVLCTTLVELIIRRRKKKKHEEIQ